MISLGLLAAILATSACGNGTSSSDTSVSSDTTTAAPVETEAFPNVEQTNYGGEEFRIITFSEYLTENFVYAEEQTGDQMQDALYERIRLTEEYLGIDITYDNSYTLSTYYPAVSQSVMAGDDAIQLVMTHVYMNLSAMATEELLYDWKNLPGVDLSADWWNQNCNEAMEIFGKQYYAVSDFSLVSPEVDGRSSRRARSYGRCH